MCLEKLKKLKLKKSESKVGKELLSLFSKKASKIPNEDIIHVTPQMQEKAMCEFLTAINCNKFPKELLENLQHFELIELVKTIMEEM